MEGFYIGLLGFLFVLMVFDLVVGVSNDAVNFLTSAIGAKVATLKTILLVAAIGGFIGAVSGNGMMEIARNGILHPSYFTFSEVMIVFVAVLASDVLLLDIFNSLGMPTSTTVSMVFELLGGAFTLALLKIARDPSLHVGELLNTGKALSVILAIFVSVAIAFVVGTVVMYLSRLLFTFTYNKNRSTLKIALFGGLSGAAILYFMVLKCFGGMFPAEIKTWLMANQGLFFLAAFVVMGLIMGLLYSLKVNVFRILVLMGTFALAMAFAGNDLVNFIGVPLAGLSSFMDWRTSGVPDNEYLMTSLDSPATTPVWMLLIAGAIMVISLVTSKKAMRVVMTSVDLSRQGGGDEMFGSSKIARMVVRTSRGVASWFSNVMPESVKRWARSRFNSDEVEDTRGAAFDEVRAAVNLVVASLLIALGTSLRLPLSTTYVTFMVAMGTSLADKAWGRESAVFRITGVVSVIGGWFITAGAAFTICAAVVFAMFFTGKPGTVIIASVALFILAKRNLGSKGKATDDAEELEMNEMLSSNNPERVQELLVHHVFNSQHDLLDHAGYLYRQATDGFMLDDPRLLEKTQKAVRTERVTLKNVRRKEMTVLRRIPASAALEKNTWFHVGVNSCEDILYSLMRICDQCQEHIDNNFVPISEEQAKVFRPLRDTLAFAVRRVADVLASGDLSDMDSVRDICLQAEKCFSEERKATTERLQTDRENLTTAYVYLNMLQESQQILISLKHLIRADVNFGGEGPVKS